jgi:hypothetical protein
MNYLILMMIWSTISCTMTLAANQKRIFSLLLHFAWLFLQEYRCSSKEQNTNMFTWWILTFSLNLLNAMEVLPPNIHQERFCAFILWFVSYLIWFFIQKKKEEDIKVNKHWIIIVSFQITSILYSVTFINMAYAITCAQCDQHIIYSVLSHNSLW